MSDNENERQLALYTNTGEASFKGYKRMPLVVGGITIFPECINGDQLITAMRILPDGKMDEIIPAIRVVKGVKIHIKDTR